MIGIFRWIGEYMTRQSNGTDGVNIGVYIALYPDEAFAFASHTVHGFLDFLGWCFDAMMERDCVIEKC
jgi:hypothetical protein